MTEPRPIRGDDIEITLPFGAKVRASGKQVTLIILVIVGVCAVLFLLREHDLRSKAAGEVIMAQQKEVIEAVENVGYILTLNDDERKALKMNMPTKLRRQLLESERTRGER